MAAGLGFLALFALLAVVTFTGTETMASIRAYAVSGARISAAHGTATASLYRYALRRRASDYEAFRTALGPLRGDRLARGELARPRPRMEVVRRGFRQAGLPPRDIKRVATFLQRFRAAGFVDRALMARADEDRLVARLEVLGRRVKERVDEGDPADLDPLLDQLAGLETELVAAEERFNSAMHEGAGLARDFLAAGLLLLLGLILLSSASGAWLLHRQIRSREAALSRNVRQHQRILESAPVPMAVHRDGEVLYANAAAVELFGVPGREMLLGGRFIELLHPDDRPRAMERSHAVERDGRDAELEEQRVVRLDGEVRYIESKAIPVMFQGGPATLMIGRDVTEERRAEAALHESEARYRRLFQDSHDAVYITDVDGTIVDMNPAGLDLFGFTREDLKNVRAQDVYVDRAERERFRRAIEETGFVEGYEVELRRRDGEVIDCLLTTTTRRNGAGEIVGYQGIIRNITERKKFEQQLERRALHDPLTDLPNRALFWDRLDHAMAQARRTRDRLAVLFVDLDRFKVVNDSLGHMAGDNVLVSVARRLTACVREQDTVARFGGDEFTVLLEGLHDVDDAVDVAERIARSFNTPFVAAQEEIHLQGGIGIAIYDPDAVLEGSAIRKGDDLVRRADMAMYRTKGRSERDYHIFDPRTDDEERGRLQQENELRRAIESGELVLHYQPIVSLVSGQIVGVEPLVRWCHPERGLVPPDEFVPLAEETGLIVPLGEWVLETACREVVDWTANGAGRPLFLNPNLSARQFEEPGLDVTVRRILEQSGLPPERLHLEVTEHMVMLVPERLKDLKRLGVGIAIDDFGTGYSSLSYVRHLKIDALKIDRSFVDGLEESPQDEAIVRTIITLGATLGLDVVAEGIERPEQLDRLRRLRCGWGQGHYFARPMPAEEFVCLLDRDPTW